MLFFNLLVAIGLSRCSVDYGIFYGEWISSPDPSILMPADGSPLFLIVPIHVDDGLGVMNSSLLYKWFLSSLSQHLHILHLGPCSKFLSMVIVRD